MTDITGAFPQVSIPQGRFTEPAVGTSLPAHAAGWCSWRGSATLQGGSEGIPVGIWCLQRLCAPGRGASSGTHGLPIISDSTVQAQYQGCPSCCHLHQ